MHPFARAASSWAGDSLPLLYVENIKHKDGLDLFNIKQRQAVTSRAAGGLPPQVFKFGCKGARFDFPATRNCRPSSRSTAPDVITLLLDHVLVTPAGKCRSMPAVGCRQVVPECMSQPALHPTHVLALSCIAFCCFLLSRCRACHRSCGRDGNLGPPRGHQTVLSADQAFASCSWPMLWKTSCFIIPPTPVHPCHPYGLSLYRW